MERLTVALLAVLVVAALAAAPALAQPSVQDPNCSFANGKTTCVTTTQSSYITTQQDGFVQRFCPGHGYIIVPLLHDYQIDVTSTTTTVYKGRSDQVESTQTTTSQQGPYPVGTWYANCP